MGFGEGARDERLHAYLAGVAVERDGEAEGFEEASARLGVGARERFVQVGQAIQDLAGAVDVERAVAAALVAGGGERGREFVSLGLKRVDALADEVWVDAGLDGAELQLDALVDVGLLAFEAGAVVVLVGGDFLCEGSVLASEVGDAVGAEDVLGEEAVDDVEKDVLADVLPFAVPERFRCLVAVGDAVGAGVVGDALAFLPVHAEWVVAGGAVDDPAQLVEAALAASPLRALAAAPFRRLGGGAFEPLVRDERLVAALGLDPFVVASAEDGAVADLRAAEVEPVPVEAAGVDGVGEDRADGRLRPFAGGVAAAVDVLRGRRPVGPVEVVGELFEAVAGEVALEDLDDHRRLLGVGDEARLVVAGAGAARVRVRLALEPVAVGGAAAVAVTLAGVLDLAAAGLAAELLDLELVERLEDVADEASFGAGLVARRYGVEDVDTCACEFTLVGECVEEVAGKAGGRVDDDGVEAAAIAVARFADEFAPGRAVVAAPAFLVGELDGDPAAALFGFAGAGFALRRKRERRVLLVPGREPAVPGEATGHRLLPIEAALASGMLGCEPVESMRLLTAEQQVKCITRFRFFDGDDDLPIIRDPLRRVRARRLTSGLGSGRPGVRRTHADLSARRRRTSSR